MILRIPPLLFLQMSRYNLEKKVQEQERQLHLQGSSRENYLSQVNQLEQNCLSVSRQANEVTEHMERLEANGRTSTCMDGHHAVFDVCICIYTCSQTGNGAAKEAGVRE